MKTYTKTLVWLFLSIGLLFIANFSAQAQYPVNGAPLWNTPGGVSEGLLQNLDQSTSPIWFKVNGNIVGQQPHNKLHNPSNTNKAGSYVIPGAIIDVNFNVNKNIANRYTLVSYTVAPDGTRDIFDYQSNLYNQSAPVQGNSNQQKILVPTNCDWEVYFVKGTLVESFMASGAQHLTNGPLGNPYAYKADGITLRASDPNSLGGNLILGYTFGDAKLNTTCEACPTVIANPNNQVFTKLIEVIEQPNSDKELLFSVINLNGTTAAPYTVGNKTFELIGDILFSGITPTHTRNNTPYGMRSDYQLGPVLANYTVGNPVVFGPKDAFVFDQRNNHNNLAFDTYQSEVVRFKVSAAEYARLSTPGVTPQPEICVELSSKQPEPHKTLVPIYCFNIDFDCAPPCPVVTDICEVSDCNYVLTYTGASAVVDPANPGTAAAYIPAFDITNVTGGTITSVTFTTFGSTANSPGYDPLGPVTFTINADPNLLTFDNAPATPWNTANSLISFFYTVPASSVAIVDPVTGDITFMPGNTVTVTVTGSMGTLTGTFDLTAEIETDCQIVPFDFPLPVEMISFTGNLTNEGIALNWRTASEKNNDRFEVERSADGRNFEKIGSVKGNGTSNIGHAYSYLDKKALSGANYYRLNQVDLNGKNERTMIIRVNAERAIRNLGVQLVPNPCLDQNCTVKLQNIDTSAPLTVELRDLTGRLIFSKQVASDQTSFQMPNVNTGNGIYILKATNGTYTAHQKIIIQ